MRNQVRGVGWRSFGVFGLDQQIFAEKESWEHEVKKGQEKEARKQLEGWMAADSGTDDWRPEDRRETDRDQGSGNGISSKESRGDRGVGIYAGVDTEKVRCLEAVGDSERYDAITDWESFLSRVQVRTTESLVNGVSYAVHCSVFDGKKLVPLTKKDIDVLAAYIFPRNIWYIIPVEKFTPRKGLWFFPDGSKRGAMFEKYREAWHLLKGRKKRKRRARRR